LVKALEVKTSAEALDHISQLMFNAAYDWTAPLQKKVTEVIRNELEKHEEMAR